MVQQENGKAEDQRLETQYYAQLDTEGYCIALSQLSGEVERDNLVRLTEMDTAYLNRKYDKQEKQWLAEYREEGPEKAEIHLSNGEVLLLEAIAVQYEESQANRIKDLEMQASIYEAILTVQKGGNI